ncbi:Myotubularin-like phosphatase domain [Balamuthia mandrillaris]
MEEGGVGSTASNQQRSSSSSSASSSPTTKQKKNKKNTRKQRLKNYRKVRHSSDAASLLLREAGGTASDPRHFGGNNNSKEDDPRAKRRSMLGSIVANRKSSAKQEEEEEEEEEASEARQDGEKTKSNTKKKEAAATATSSSSKRSDLLLRVEVKLGEEFCGKALPSKVTIKLSPESCVEDALQQIAKKLCLTGEADELRASCYLWDPAQSVDMFQSPSAFMKSFGLSTMDVLRLERKPEVSAPRFVTKNMPSKEKTFSEIIKQINKEKEKQDIRQQLSNSSPDLHCLTKTSKGYGTFRKAKTRLTRPLTAKPNPKYPDERATTLRGRDANNPFLEGGGVGGMAGVGGGGGGESPLELKLRASFSHAFYQASPELRSTLSVRATHRKSSEGSSYASLLSSSSGSSVLASAGPTIGGPSSEKKLLTTSSSSSSATSPLGSYILYETGFEYTPPLSVETEHNKEDGRRRGSFTLRNKRVRHDVLLHEMVTSLLFPEEKMRYVIQNVAYHGKELPLVTFEEGTTSGGSTLRHSNSAAPSQSSSSTATTTTSNAVFVNDTCGTLYFTNYRMRYVRLPAEYTLPLDLTEGKWRLYFVDVPLTTIESVHKTRAFAFAGIRKKTAKDIPTHTAQLSLAIMCKDFRRLDLTFFLPKERQHMDIQHFILNYALPHYLDETFAFQSGLVHCLQNEAKRLASSSSHSSSPSSSLSSSPRKGSTKQEQESETKEEEGGEPDVTTEGATKEVEEVGGSSNANATPDIVVDCPPTLKRKGTDEFYSRMRAGTAKMQIRLNSLYSNMESSATDASSSPLSLSSLVEGRAPRSKKVQIMETVENTKPQPQEEQAPKRGPMDSGWGIYDIVKEVQRQCGDDSNLDGFLSQWRFSNCNANFLICPSYPSVVLVPQKASDRQIEGSALYRQNGCFPVPVWYNAKTQAILCRAGTKASPRALPLPSSPHPLSVPQQQQFERTDSDKEVFGGAEREDAVTGVTSGTESLSAPLLASSGGRYSPTRSHSPSPISSPASSLSSSPYQSIAGGSPPSSSFFIPISASSSASTILKEEEIQQPTTDPLMSVIRQTSPRSKLFIFAPSSSSSSSSCSSTSGGEQGSGGSTLSSPHDIADCFAKLMKLCLRGCRPERWHHKLQQTGWIQQVGDVMSYADTMAHMLEAGNSIILESDEENELVFPLSSVAQILLDPYYRTFRGFCVLLEKDWIRFCYNFPEKCNHILDTSRPSTLHVFVLFIDCVWQLTQQYPLSFEFNEDFLIILLDSLYSCRFGSFCFTGEIDRELASTHTHSLWAFLLESSHQECFRNPFYERVRSSSSAPSRIKRGANKPLAPSSPSSPSLSSPRRLRPLCEMPHLQLFSAYYLRWQNIHVQKQVRTQVEMDFAALDLSDLLLSYVPPHVGALKDKTTNNIVYDFNLVPEMCSFSSSSSSSSSFSSENSSPVSFSPSSAASSASSQKNNTTYWCQRLQQLKLSNNQINYLPVRLGQLTSLKKLYADHNHFTAFPRLMMHLLGRQWTNLRCLNLCYNELTDLTGIEAFSQLQKLYVDWNRLRHLVRPLSNSNNNNNNNINVNNTNKNKQQRSLPRFHITAVDSSPSTTLSSSPAPSLEDLNEILFPHDYDEDDDDIRQDGGGARARARAGSSEESNKGPLLPHLLTLSANHNNLREVPLNFLSNTLKVLELEANSLSLLPSQLCKLTALEVLNLKDNALSGALPGAICDSLVSLTKLELDGNQLTQLPTSIANLTRLQVLGLAGNKLVTLPPPLGTLTSIRELRLRDNSTLKSPSKQFVQTHDTKEILFWLSELLRGKSPSYRMKLLVVGQENVGKTSVLAALKSSAHKNSSNNNKKRHRLWQPQSPPLSTDGIDIEEWRMNVHLPPPEGKKKVTLSVWDFAGQEIYYSTHQFFLSERALYLLVWNVAKSEETSRVHYWLEAIRARVGAANATVLLVGTHMDECSSKEAGEAKLQRVLHRFAPQFASMLYPRAIGVSCTSGKGIKDLRRSVKEIIAAQPHLGEPFPKSLLLLEEELLKLRAKKIPPVLTWTELKVVANTCKILQEEDVFYYVKLLHNLGSIVYLPEDENLKNLLILSPHWLTEMLSSVITTKHTYIKSGVLRHKDLQHLWRAPLYPPHLHEPLLNLLEKFEIIYRLSPTSRLNKLLLPIDENAHGEADEEEENGSPFVRSLIPVLLPDERPPQLLSAWPSTLSGSEMERAKGGDAKSLNNDDPLSAIRQQTRLYRLSFVPSGFFGHLMVRLLNQNTVGELVWRNGLLAKVMPSSSVADSAGDGDSAAQRRPLLLKLELYHWKRMLEVSVRGCNPVDVFCAITASVESFIHDWFKIDVHVSMPCPHCLFQGLPIDACHMFSLEQCQTAAMSMESYLRCTNGRVPTLVRLDAVTPDLTMAEVAKIPFSELKIQEKIGSGGYATVYSALWQKELVAVKILSSIEEAPPSLQQELPQHNEAAQSNNNGREDEEEEGEGTLREVSALEGEVTLSLESETFDKKRSVLNPFRDTYYRGLPDRIFNEFRREVWMMSGLSHPNIVSFKGLSMEQGQYCIVTELLPHGNLYDYIHEPGNPLSWPLRLKIALDVAEGMKFLHYSTVPSIIHRDLKSPNVLLAALDPTSPVVAKVADFGASSVAPTLNGRTVDNPLWLAPEILQGKRHSCQADVYAFGVILYELAARKPFFSDIGFMSHIEDLVKAGRRPDIYESLNPTNRNTNNMDKSKYHPQQSQDLTHPCVEEYVALMHECWADQPASRPSFEVVVQRLKEIVASYFPELQSSEDYMEIFLRKELKEKKRKYRLSIWQTSTAATAAQEPVSLAEQLSQSSAAASIFVASSSSASSSSSTASTASTKATDDIIKGESSSEGNRGWSTMRVGRKRGKRSVSRASLHRSNSFKARLKASESEGQSDDGHDQAFSTEPEEQEDPPNQQQTTGTTDATTDHPSPSSSSSPSPRAEETITTITTPIVESDSNEQQVTTTKTDAESMPLSLFCYQSLVSAMTSSFVRRKAAAASAAAFLGTGGRKVGGQVEEEQQAFNLAYPGQVLTHHEGAQVCCLVHLQPRNTVWTAATDGKIYVWHAMSGSLIKTFEVEGRSKAPSAMLTVYLDKNSTRQQAPQPPSLQLPPHQSLSCTVWCMYPEENVFVVLNVMGLVLRTIYNVLPEQEENDAASSSSSSSSPSISVNLCQVEAEEEEVWVAARDKLSILPAAPFASSLIAKSKSTSENRVKHVLCMPAAISCVISTQNQISRQRRVWVGLQNGELVIIDVLTRKVQKTLASHESKVVCLVEVGQRVWSTDETGLIIVWDQRSQERASSLNLPAPAPASSVALVTLLCDGPNSSLQEEIEEGEEAKTEESYVWGVTQHGAILIWDVQGMTLVRVTGGEERLQGALLVRAPPSVAASLLIDRRHKVWIVSQNGNLRLWQAFHGAPPPSHNE